MIIYYSGGSRLLWCSYIVFLKIFIIGLMLGLTVEMSLHLAEANDLKVDDTQVVDLGNDNVQENEEIAQSTGGTLFLDDLEIEGIKNNFGGNGRLSKEEFLRMLKKQGLRVIEAYKLGPQH